MKGPNWSVCILFIFAVLAARGSEEALGDPSGSVDAAFRGPRVPISSPVSSEDMSENAPSASSVVLALTMSSPGKEAGVPFPQCLLPGPDGRVELRYGRAATPPTPENPFDCRIRESVPKELPTLRVGLIASGLTPLAVINAKNVQIGERVSGCNVVAIEPTGVVVERNGVFIRLPVGPIVRLVEVGEG